MGAKAQRYHFDALSVAAPAAAGAKWNLLFPTDTTRFRPDFPGGSIAITGNFLSQMLANWQRMGKPQLKVDYFHRGDSNDDLPRDEKVASGWIQDLRMGADGLEALIDWTDEARGRIEAKQLRYLSPEFAVDGFDTTTGESQGPTLYGAGLLNDPFLFDLPPVAATSNPPAPAAQEHPMEPNAFLAAVCAALGLPADTNADTAMAAIKKLALPPAEPGNAPPDGDEGEAPPPAKMSATINRAVALALEPVRAEVVRLQADNISLQAKVKVAEEKQRKDDEAELRKLALSRGYQADRIDAVIEFSRSAGLQGVREMLSALPKSPLLGELGTGAGGDEGNETPESAKAKLSVLAGEIHEKESVSMSLARERAMTRNPALANLAAQLKSVHN